ncbi:hypothetical protein AJ78_01403 [Emergomyces pasteurianus Ep9510]|uniref:Uncharacterized protein n=1 Tax=Emergomyces pasteurianus Ep9510 TaxID=1447872 RepID=A0A1J9PRL9_9EURO|nr:hypothetical protein AJ78_01403 [Emergomyces pasteurianus Ep9510]
MASSASAARNNHTSGDYLLSLTVRRNQHEDINPSGESLISRSLAVSEYAEKENIRLNFNAFTKALRTRIIPTELHDALVEWTLDGLVSREEQRVLDAGVGTAFEGFTESSWPEPLPYLRADKDIWMKGNIIVQLVILLKWSKTPGGQVKGRAEIWRRNGTGDPVATEMAIFPVPDSPVLNEQIEFTNGQHFGTAAIESQDADTVLYLRISRLRAIA